MRRLAHRLTLAIFISMPVLAETQPETRAFEVEMCGDHPAVALIDLPTAPPMNQNHCQKACHAGCLRKRKLNNTST